MAYDGWIEYNGVELVNLSRTVQLADAMGINTLWYAPNTVEWIEDALSGVDYDNPTTAPWYVEGYQPSMEFAGIVPLSVPSLDDSTMQSTPVEYVGDGGHAGATRHATLPIVFGVAIIASTDEGADYGKRWMNRVLSQSGSNRFCSGADLRYFRSKTPGSPIMHRRDVKTTRGTSITRKHTNDSSVTWWATFTMTAGDPFEYSEPVNKIGDLGGTVTGSPLSSGSTVLAETGCPEFDYSPIYDPLYPALVPSPQAPDFLPEGWDIFDGMTFQRFWARVNSVEPSSLTVVPIFTLSTTIEARFVRVSIWPSDSDINDQCDPLFSAVISYLPAGVQFIIDGERGAAYVWDGFSPSVRRADSLVYSPTARPVQWTSFNDDELLVTLDLFADSDGYEGNDTVRAALALVSKSD